MLVMLDTAVAVEVEKQEAKNIISPQFGCHTTAPVFILKKKGGPPSTQKRGGKIDPCFISC
jgi:hypothetical protein